MRDDQTYKEVLLASLLHDAGKFYGRSETIRAEKHEYARDTGLSTPHPAISGLFVERLADHIKAVGLDCETVKMLVEHHHEAYRFAEEFRVNNIDDPEKRAIALLISRADNYSSKERDEQISSGASSYFSSPIDSVFCRVKLDNQQKNQELLQIKPAHLSTTFLSGSSFPKKISSLDKGQLNRLVADFGQQVASLNAKDFDTLYLRLFDLLHEYCWAIPADIREKIKDVSLFDHLKTTSAIAACLYQYHKGRGGISEQAIMSEDDNKFLLIGGDLSGIQQYIYDISGIGTGAVAKKLRARSFKISLLMEAASQMIINELDLPYASILYCSGGRFYILAPNLESTKDKISEIGNKIEKWMLTQYTGSLALNLAMVQFNVSDLEYFGMVLEKLGSRLEEAKHKKFASQLVSVNDFIFSHVFEKEFDRICGSCHKLPAIVIEQEDEAEESKFSCLYCHEDKQLGEFLPKVRFVSFVQRNESHGESVLSDKSNYIPLNFFDEIVVAISDKKILDSAYLIYDVSASSESLPAANVNDKPIINRFIANYVPKNKNGKIKTFNEIADEAKGTKYLGVLKADVDRLGLIFSRGLGENASISRLSVLSRMLDLFFTGYLPWLIKSDYQTVYIVYSGGDDLLLVGPWDTLFDLSWRLYKDFREYTANNASITLSAGLALTTKKTPVWHMADAAEEQIKKSKNKGRDRLTVFNTAFKWDKYNALADNANTLAEGMDASDGVSTSLVYSLLQFCPCEDPIDSIARPSNKPKNDALNRARLTYQIARHLENKEQESPQRKKLRELLIKLTQSENSDWWSYMAVPISNALIRIRAKGGKI
ncbi:MAG: type III-A CRISPR-associated protein Cas10/Csm1 [Actinobacteria bacterium]|nr:type III-A CRISPR-associated protein Cas10/Csm1 [Actinomycetota bacterium]